MTEGAVERLADTRADTIYIWLDLGFFGWNKETAVFVFIKIVCAFVIDDGFESNFTFGKTKTKSQFFRFFFQELFGASVGFIGDLVCVLYERFRSMFQVSV